MSDEESSAMLAELSNRSDLLITTRLDIIMKWVFFALAPISFILCFIFSTDVVRGLIAAFCTIIAGILAGYPQMLWKLTTMQLHWRYNVTDATPKTFWSAARKILYWFFGVSAIVLVVISIQ